MTTPFTIHRKRTHHRSKNVVMVAEDVRAFSEILAKEYPDARYYMDPTAKQRNYLYRPGEGILREKPPRILIDHSLYRIWQSAHRWNTDITMVPDTGWKPTWEQVKDHREHPHWYLLSPRKPYVWFRKVGRFYTEKDKVVADIGFISIHCVPGNKAHLQFANRFFRLFGKIANDRNFTREKGGAVVETYVGKTSWTWVGHAARQWAAEKPNRYLYGGLRPLLINAAEA